jgi:hypothetical protein
VTYYPDGNILKSLYANLLWKATVEKEDKNRLNVVTLPKSRIGSWLRSDQVTRNANTNASMTVPSL